MGDYKRQQEQYECKDPADQPRPPGDGEKCPDLPSCTPPKLEDPEPCPEDPNCKCPKDPGSNPNCLEELIAKQAADIAVAEEAKKFKTALEELLNKAKTASQDYTRDKYEKLVKLWEEQDCDIVELIRKLVCAVPCWRCIIECHVCRRINELHDAEQRLYGDGTLYTDVHNLHDLLYWHQRNKEKTERRFNRIKSVLAAWEKPAQTIEKILNDNKQLIEEAGKSLGSKPGKVVYDVFLKLVPMHLAIAPPSNSPWKTKIPKEYTQFCKCDTGTPDDCCGPDVGERSLRQRLIGYQPNLIDPSDYYMVICCLVEKRYGPAQEAFCKAEAELVKSENEIKRYKAVIENGLKSFETDAKGDIPSVINCCEYEKKEDESR